MERVSLSVDPEYSKLTQMSSFSATENPTMVSRSYAVFLPRSLHLSITVGPFDTPHTDDGSSKWAKDMPHDAMLEFAKPYIAAFKTGSPTPIIERDMLVYWHRPTLKNVECDATDNCGSRPEGWEVGRISLPLLLSLT